MPKEALPPANPMVPREWAEFFCEVDAESATEAAQVGAALVLVVLDDLSFRMHQPLVISRLEAIDVSAPVAVGDEREMLLFPYPGGYPNWRVSRSQAMDHLAVAIVLRLRDHYSEKQGRDRRAYDWYLKSMSTPYEVDQFIFMWVAIEILAKSDPMAQVKAPLRARCSHEIPNCPECGEPTTKPVEGLMNRAYLTRFGASEEAARALWRTRMMLHGATDLTQDGVGELSAQVPLLRACVVSALKDRLGIDSQEVPLVNPSPFTIRAEMALGGRRPLAEADLDGSALEPPS